MHQHLISSSDKTPSILRNLNLKAALFDLDATLVDTFIDFKYMRSEVVRLALEKDVPADEMQMRDMLGIIDIAIDYLRSQGSTKDASQLYLDAHKRIREIEMQHAADAVEVPGARELLDILKSNNVKTGIVTRNCRDASLLSMQLTGINADILITREDSVQNKPHPEPVLMALKKLGTPAKQSIMVGDHTMDVLSGRAAGCTTIGFLREDRSEDFFEDTTPDSIIKTLGELSLAIIDINS